MYVPQIAADLNGDWHQDDFIVRDCGPLNWSMEQSSAWISSVPDSFKYYNTSVDSWMLEAFDSSILIWYRPESM